MVFETYDSSIFEWSSWLILETFFRTTTSESRRWSVVSKITWSQSSSSVWAWNTWLCWGVHDSTSLACLLRSRGRRQPNQDRSQIWRPSRISGIFIAIFFLTFHLPNKTNTSPHYLKSINTHSKKLIYCFLPLIPSQVFPPFFPYFWFYASFSFFMKWAKSNLSRIHFHFPDLNWYITFEPAEFFSLRESESWKSFLSHYSVSFALKLWHSCPSSSFFAVWVIRYLLTFNRKFEAKKKVQVIYLISRKEILLQTFTQVTLFYSITCFWCLVITCLISLS